MALSNNEKQKRYRNRKKLKYADLEAAPASTIHSLRYAVLIQQKEELILSLESFIDRIKRFDIKE